MSTSSTTSMSDKPYKSTTERPFKERKVFAQRHSEALDIRTKFPSKVPVIAERHQREKFLPYLDKTKFLIPQQLTMSQFLQITRSRMALNSSQALYILVNNKSMSSMSTTMAEVYATDKDEDGFLYMTYASQEAFG